MYDYDEPDYYYEPSEADEILGKAKSELELLLKDSIKSKIDGLDKREASITAREEKLKENNTKLRGLEYQLETREKEIERKEKRTKQDLEKGYYKTKLGDIISYMDENFVSKYYEIDSDWKQVSKCDACDDNRSILVVLPNKTERRIDCSCKLRRNIYKVSERLLVEISLNNQEYKFENSYSDEWTTVVNSDIIKKINLKELRREDGKLKKGAKFKTKELAIKYLELINSEEK